MDLPGAFQISHFPLQVFLVFLRVFFLGGEGGGALNELSMYLMNPKINKLKNGCVQVYPLCT